MEKLKFGLFSVIVLALLGLFGYWAVTTLQSGSDHVSSQKLAQLQKDNDDLKDQVASLTAQLDTYTSKIPDSSTDQPDTVMTPPTPPQPKPTPTTNPTVYKNQTLINELQKLVSDNVTMKLHSSGTRVGTVQRFLNLYNKTSNKVDNDYGASTQKAIMAFQKDQGLTQSGECSKTTFNKMIDWLKKQG